MRIIKFRFWDTVGNVMLDWGCVCQTAFNRDGELGLMYRAFTSRIVSQTLIPMQYIGVKGYVGDYKDRRNNEVELYEGDIVEAMSEGSKGTFIIHFRNEASPCFILYPAWQHGKTWSIHGSDIGRDKGDYYDDLKRIGNIYENPELSSTLQTPSDRLALHYDNDLQPRKGQSASNNAKPVLAEVPSIYDMKLHQVTDVCQEPYFRVMRVAGGWLYDFWNNEKQEYNSSWSFVPFNNEFM